MTFHQHLTKFDARFDSECAECGNDMYEGNPIARTSDGNYICEDCFDDVDDAITTEKRKQWQQQRLSGSTDGSTGTRR